MAAILDSSAVIAHVSRELGWEVVERHVNAGGCSIHGVNICEILYHYRKKVTAQEAETIDVA